MSDDEHTKVVRDLAQKSDADVYVFSGEINHSNADRLIVQLRRATKRHKNAALALTTSGGSADAAYRLFGLCKSAGTLVAVAADEIVMSEFGELGPLDVQLADKQELFGQTPALDISQALSTLSNYSFSFFTNHFFGMNPGQGINTQTASDIAKTLTLGILEPIAKQIDPLLLGRVERSLRIAEAYSQRLNPKFQSIKQLVQEYPSHRFVIDFEEAKKLFGAVREPTPEEETFEEFLRGCECVPSEARVPVICLLGESLKEDVDDVKSEIVSGASCNGLTKN